MICLVLAAHSQNPYTISGTIRDKNKEPLPGAAVYLSGYKLAAVADADGRFALKGLQAGNYEVLVQMIGFLPQTKSVIISDASKEIEMIMAENIKLLNEVVVRPDPRRDFYLKLFTENFIGNSTFAQKCEIMNPEVIITEFDEVKKVLKITCTDFLIIENKALGYRIKYLLEAFECDEKSTLAAHYGHPTFEELKAGSSQKKQYLKNRNIAYKGSPQHFFSALYANKVKEEGFILNKLEKVRNPNKLPDSVIDRKVAHFSTPLRDAVRGNVTNRNDSLYYWKRMYNQPEFMIVHNKEEVLIDTLVKNQQKDLKSINFNNILYLAYTKEKEGKDFAKQEGYAIKRPRAYLDYQISLVRQLSGPVSFYQNGRIFNPMSLLYEGFWSYEKVGDLMPMDYQN